LKLDVVDLKQFGWVYQISLRILVDVCGLWFVGIGLKAFSKKGYEA